MLVQHVSRIIENQNLEDTILNNFLYSESIGIFFTLKKIHCKISISAFYDKRYFIQFLVFEKVVKTCREHKIII